MNFQNNNINFYQNPNPNNYNNFNNNYNNNFNNNNFNNNNYNNINNYNNNNNMTSNQQNQPYTFQQSFNNNTQQPQKNPQNNIPQESEYLISRNLKNISEQEFTDFISSLNIQNLKELKSNIENLENNMQKVGYFNTLPNLIEKIYNFREDKHDIMVKKYKLLSQDIFKHRSIYGDGNCFYRSVLVSYLEQLILFKEINAFKNFVFDVKACLDSSQVSEVCNYLDEQPKFDKFLIMRILVLIYVGIKNDKIKETYKIFIKALNGLPLFDQGLIMYLRFSIFRYIKENENKLYSKDFAVQIGNLLPEQFETKDGKFLFRDFYIKFLLKPGKLAEKIIIYITPYVLCSKLEVVMFEMENDWRKTFDFVGNKNSINNLNTVLIYLPGHYQLIYTTEFYQKYYNIFKEYSDFSYRNEIMTEIVVEQQCKDVTLLDVNSDSQNNNNDIFNMNNNINNNNINNNMNNNMNNNNFQFQQNQYNNNNFNFNNVQNNNMPLCEICRNDSVFETQIYNYCINCFMRIFKIKFKEIYFKSMEKLNILFQNNPEEYIQSLSNMIAHSEINLKNNKQSSIFNKRTTSNDLIFFINNYLPQNLKIHMPYLLSSVKKNYCLQCQRELNKNEERIILPCSCLFCNPQCLINHFTNNNMLIINSSKNNFCTTKNQKFYCRCSNIYDYSQLLNLIFIFKKFDQELAKMGLKYFCSMVKELCCNCENNVKIKNKSGNNVLIECKNCSEDPNWTELGPIFRFKHLFCWNCYMKVIEKNINQNNFINNMNNNRNQNTIFFCQLCKNQHTVERIVDKNYTFATDDKICGIF